MGNRKLPFGYQMRMGEIVRNEPEAKAVQDIFLQYSLGASLKEIAEQMSKTGPAYDEGKSWNKNMVARILDNAKYTGVDSYPKLVDIRLFEAAAEKRQTKQRLPARTPAQKALKRVCSKPPTPEIEQQVMHLFGRLAEQPERIRPQGGLHKPPARPVVMIMLSVLARPRQVSVRQTGLWTAFLSQNSEREL